MERKDYTIQIQALSFASTLYTFSGILQNGNNVPIPYTNVSLSGSGTVAGIHTCTAAGNYTVTLTMTDSDGPSGSSQFQYVTIYDPAAGSLGAVGTFTSPAGAYPANPLLTGPVTFASGASYQNGTLIGITRIAFPVANLTFQSTATQWLVVTKPKATIQASGTLNGSGNYTIILSGIDGTLPGGGGTDKVRVKIIDSSNTVIYDTQQGAPLTADPTTLLTAGAVRMR